LKLVLHTLPWLDLSLFYQRRTRQHLYNMPEIHMIFQQ
jgi:hypothetical protein